MSADVEADVAGEVAAALAAPKSWPVVVELVDPIMDNGVAIRRLEFQRGKLGMLKGMKPDGVPSFDQVILVGSRMCNVEARILAELSESDAAEVTAIVLGFFARCLGAGAKRSR